MEQGAHGARNELEEERLDKECNTKTFSVC